MSAYASSPIRYIRNWSDLHAAGVFFPEAVEGDERPCSRTIERSLYRNYAAQGIILHVVGEYHQLGDVDEAAELLV